MTRSKLAVGALGATLGAAVPAAAQDYTDDGEFYLGRSISFGGGVSNFTEDDPRDVTGTAGGWDVRVGLRTWLPIGAEVAYLGSAQNIDAIGLDNDAVLLSNGAEVVARLNILPGMTVNPYALAGGAWRRYDIVNSNRNTADLLETDNVFEVPLGLGVDFRLGNFLLDARATYRIAFDDELMAGPGEVGDDVGLDTDMHTFGGRIGVGVEF